MALTEPKEFQVKMGVQTWLFAGERILNGFLFNIYVAFKILYSFFFVHGGISMHFLLFLTQAGGRPQPQFSWWMKE